MVVFTSPKVSKSLLSISSFNVKLKQLRNENSQ